MDTQKDEMCQDQNLKESAIPQRGNYWEEIGVEEKIERLRNLVKSLVLTIDRQKGEIYDLKTFVWDHSHNENGETIVKISRKDRGRLENSSNGLNWHTGAKTPSQGDGKVFI